MLEYALFAAILMMTVSGVFLYKAIVDDPLLSGFTTYLIGAYLVFLALAFGQLNALHRKRIRASPKIPPPPLTYAVKAPRPIFGLTSDPTGCASVRVRHRLRDVYVGAVDRALSPLGGDRSWSGCRIVLQQACYRFRRLRAALHPIVDAFVLQANHGRLADGIVETHYLYRPAIPGALFINHHHAIGWLLFGAESRQSNH